MTVVHVLAVLACVLLMVECRLILGSDDEVMSCEDLKCETGHECYMIEAPCEEQPCERTPHCRPSCNVTLCIPGFVCLEGQCVLHEKAFIDLCVLITCDDGYNCTNGECVGPCDNIDCQPGEECYLTANETATFTSCRPHEDCGSSSCLLYYIFGILSLYLFLVAPLCLYFMCRLCRRSKVEPNPT